MKKETISKLKKRIRKRTLFFLIIALMANTFAWFIYSNKVSNSITTGVKSWKITFDQDGQTLEQNVEFNFDDIYPGVNNQEKSIDITNNGEMKAYITYKLESIQIFDEIYTIDNYSSLELENILKNNYPFKIVFSNDDEINIGDTASFKVSLSWPFESGDDEKDTYYGKKSFEFKQNSMEEQIKIKVKIKASQTKD